MNTKSFTIIFLLLIILVSPVLSQVPAEEPDELEAYIADIREWRMTESARMSLRMLAGIYTEGTILTFKKDESSGLYWRSYQSSSCPKPDMDPAERARLRNEYESKIAPILSKLHPLADKDNSGFVTEEEGAKFRDVVEFAYQAVYVASQEGAGSEGFYTGMSMDEERFKQRVAEYKDMFLKARESGLDFPEINF